MGFLFVLFIFYVMQSIHSVSIHEYAKNTINEFRVFEAPALIKRMIPGVLQD